MRINKTILVTLSPVLLSLQFLNAFAEEQIEDIGRFNCQTTGDATNLEFSNGKPITFTSRHTVSRFTIDYKSYFLSTHVNSPMVWQVRSSRDDIYWYGETQGYDSQGLAYISSSSFVFGSPQSARVSLVRHYRNDWNGFVVNTLEIDEGLTIIEPVTCSQFKGFNGF